MKNNNIISTITEGKYTYILAEVNDRPKELEQPNFRGTGKALVAIREAITEGEKLNHAYGLDKREGGHKPYIRWSNVDFSNVGTTKII